MSLLFIDGWDHYATADITKKWNTILTGDQAPSISASAARTGTQGFRSGVVSNAQEAQRVTVTVAPATPASGVMGFAFRPSGNGNSNSRVMSVIDAGTEQFNVQGNSDGTLSVERSSTTLGTTSAAVPLNQWTFIEVKWTINDTTGSVQIRFNGDTVLSLSNVDTKNTSNATWGTVSIGGAAVSLGAPATTWDYDDLYLCDLGGSTNNDFLGDVRVDAHYPNANGNSSNWTRSTGSDQYATIDELLQNGDSDYNSTGAISTTDTLNFPNLINAGSAIHAVQVCCCGRKEDAGGGSLAAIVRHSGTDYEHGTPQGLATTYTIHRFLYPTNPGTSAAWTESGFNNAEFGYRKTA